MSSSLLSKLWHDMCKSHNIPNDKAVEWWSTIQTFYSEKQRAYHTMSHLDELNGHYSSAKSIMQSPSAVAWTLFFHDIIYEPKRKDNEEKSAELWSRFCQEMRPLGASLPEPLQSKVYQYIVLTKNHTACPADADPDAVLFLDMDLAILGSDRHRYEQYAEQIRAEYRHIPYLFYCSGRAGVLRTFAAAPRLFRTPLFHEKCDAAARLNLLWEVERLEKARKGAIVKLCLAGAVCAVMAGVFIRSQWS